MKRTKRHQYIRPHLIPIIAVLCLLPLIVYGKVMVFDTSKLSWYTQDTTYMVDIFNYYKSVLLIITGSTMCLIISYRYYKGKRQLKVTPLIIVGTYILIVVLSTLFSQNPSFALKGYENHLEHMTVLIAYMMVFIYTAEVVKTTEQITTLTNFWMVSILSLTCIGITQFIGVDFYRTELGLTLMLPPGLKEQISDVKFTLWGDNLIYQSLFHYNYVSFYSAMSTPYFLTLLITDVNKRRKIIYGAIVFMLLFNLLASQGRNGLVGLALGCLTIIVFYPKKVLFNRYALGSIVVVIVSSLLVLMLTDTIYERRLTSVFTGITTTVDYPLNGITTDGNHIHVDHDNFQLTITNDPGTGQLLFYADPTLTTQLNVEQTLDGYTIISEDTQYDYNLVTVSEATYNNTNLLILTIDGNDWHFGFFPDNIQYLNSYGSFDHIATADAIGFQGREQWGSKRGYIWSRTIPIILERPLLGAGPDNYVIAFPQNDYVGKSNAYGYESRTIVVDKPHNIFLNYATNTGIPSLMVILALLLLLIVNTFHVSKS